MNSLRSNSRRHRLAGALSGAAVGVSLLTTAASSAAYAQVPFRIARPANGSNVRETVRITIPRSSLSGVQYLSLTIDGHFRSAIAVPERRADNKLVKADMIEASSQNVALLWDTKAKDLATPNLTDAQRVVGDGPHKVEIIALDRNGKRVGAETLTLNVSNRSGLALPAEGVPLNYRFQIGDGTRYRQITNVEYIGENRAPAQGRQRRGYTSPGFGQGGGGFAPGGYGGEEMGGGGPPSYAGGGGRPGNYGGGGGGGRPGNYGAGYGPPGGRGGSAGPGGFGQAAGMPPGGYGGGAVASGPFTIPVQNVRADYERSTEDYLGDGLYFLRDRVLKGVIIGGNGAAAKLEEVFDFKSRYRSVLNSGRIREYGVASSTRPGAYVSLLIPDLGGGRRRIGQTWRTQTPVLLEWATMDKPPVVSATNTLENVEWQNGYQTARIRQTFQGKANMPIFGGAGEMTQANVSMDRTIWFAFKAGKIIRMDTDVNVDGNAPSDVLSAMVPQAGISGGGMGVGAGMGGGFGGEDEGGFPAFGGQSSGIGGGLGGIQQQQEAPKVPAKFHSTTTVTLLPPGTK